MDLDSLKFTKSYDPSNPGDMQKSAHSVIANISRILFEILVNCKNSRSRSRKQSEFVGIGQHTTFPAGWGNIQISRRTCWTDMGAEHGYASR